MADKSSQLVLSALTRAAADTAGVPLHGTRTTPGLFPATAVGKQAARCCCEEGYLSTADGSACTITDKGLTYLLGQVSPRQVLEDFVRVLELRESQVVELLASAQPHAGQPRCPARHRQHGFASRLLRLAETSSRSSASSATSPPVIRFPRFPLRLARPRQRTSSAKSACCSLAGPPPGRAKTARCLSCLPGSRLHSPQLTIGAFHDVLRQMHDENVVYLHPWTGPLYAIPQPPFALLVGHEIAYYASLRDESSAAA